MDELRTPPGPPKAARLFNLAVAVLVFLLMLSFAVWLILSAIHGGGEHASNSFRAVAGTLIMAAATVLLVAVADEWRTGEPFQQSSKTLFGMALLGLGTTVLAFG